MMGENLRVKVFKPGHAWTFVIRSLSLSYIYIYIKATTVQYLLPSMAVDVFVWPPDTGMLAGCTTEIRMLQERAAARD